MAKDYLLQFGSSDPSAYTGLTPTFTFFTEISTGTTVSPPGITELAGSGLYTFSYGPTLALAFVCDGGSGLSSEDRYIVGTLDPIQSVDEKVGTTDDSFGTTLTDPSTVIGYLKRNLEFQEGDANFTKSTGTWDIYSRGSSTLLREKTLTNTSSQANKS